MISLVSYQQEVSSSGGTADAGKKAKEGRKMERF